jgi:rhodanese-related sulfurtransferase
MLPNIGNTATSHLRLIANNGYMTSTTASPSGVTAIPAAASPIAIAHFASLLSLETDCWDVHDAMTNGPQDFVLLQTSATDESFASEHIDGAIHLHHSKITEATLSAWPADTTFVVYCAGPHCNGADRGALNIARLGRSVKKMIGGKAGWLDEGFSFVSS